MEQKIDIELYSTFFSEGNCYQCIEGTSCNDCGFKPDSELCKRFFCNNYTRKDNTNVVFKRIYEYPNLNKNNMEKTIKLTLEQARELYKKDELCKSIVLNSFSKEELEQQELPKTWEEYCNNHYCKGYYLSKNSIIEHFFEYVYNSKLDPKCDKNTFESKENAEAILALCQLIRLRDEYNGYTPIDYEKEYPYNPHTIVYNLQNNYYTLESISKYSKYSTYKYLFVFHNKELAREFLKNFKHLLDKFYKIMY